MPTATDIIMIYLLVFVDTETELAQTDRIT